MAGWAGGGGVQVKWGRGRNRTNGGYGGCSKEWGGSDGTWWYKMISIHVTGPQQARSACPEREISGDLVRFTYPLRASPLDVRIHGLRWMLL